MADSQRTSATVFLVDDEPSLLRLVVRVLEGEGHDLITADHADVALGLFEESHERIDAVILDAQIQPRGAEPLLDAILAQRKEMPVILSSGSNLAPGLRDRLDACGGQFLRKPFLPRHLVELVEQVVPGGKKKGGS